VKTNLALGLAPTVRGLAILVAIARTAQFDRVLLDQLVQCAYSSRQAEPLKLAPTCCHASATAVSGMPSDVSLLFSMASLSDVDSTPRAYRLKAGNAARKVSTDAGTSPLGMRSFGRAAEAVRPGPAATPGR
jgi:hypothetical protein